MDFRYFNEVENSLITLLKTYVYIMEVNSVRPFLENTKNSNIYIV